MEFRELVGRRRMVRRFQPRPVSRDLVLRVLEVARHAPSAGFSQGFDFVVLDDPEAVKRLFEVTNHPEFPYDPLETKDLAPCYIVAISNVPAYLERYSRPDKERFGLQKAEAWPVPFWDVDTGMAVMLILLAAVEEKLGAVFFGVNWGREELMRELGVPEDCRFIGVIALGHPLDAEAFDSARFTARRRSLESMVHFGGW
ncbi:MAG TPA: nitroreductase family protein [Candidatus Dormibacteraeota bacterium]|nr:nitroreductase family protein [Candidatus Dormibacteraeota bacterium]